MYERLLKLIKANMPDANVANATKDSKLMADLSELLPLLVSMVISLVVVRELRINSTWVSSRVPRLP